MKITENAQKLLRQRYYISPTETWAMLSDRVVKHVCAGENYGYKQSVYNDIHNLVWLPNSPCLVNSGKLSGGLMACFVRDVEDDTLEAIFECVSDIAQIAKRGGGAGFSPSLVRAENSPVAGSTHGYAIGPNGIASIVSHNMDKLSQSGFRRMALMYALDAYHPDAEKFVGLKHSGNEGEMYNFNQSLFANDHFMGKAFSNPYSGEGGLLRKIIHGAWSAGEPGLLFADRINDSPYTYSGQVIRCSNPCKLK